MQVDRLYGIQNDAARLRVAHRRQQLKRWATTSPAVACLHLPDVLASKGALHFAHDQLARDNDAPLRQTNSHHTADADAPTDSAAETLNLLALVIHELLLDVCPPPPDPLHLARRLRQTRLHVRVHSLRPATPISSLKADKIGRLLSIRGTVVRASSLQPFVTEARFTCPRCRESCVQLLDEGRFEAPAGCPLRGCKATKLVLDRRSSLTRDWQKLRLQEMPSEGEQDLQGRIPMTVEVELRDDLVDCCKPGDQLEVTGVVKSMEVSESGGPFRGGGSNKPKCIYVLYVDAASVTSLRASSGGGGGGGGGGASADADAQVGDVGGDPILSQGLSLGGAGGAAASVDDEARSGLSAADVQAIRNLASEPEIFRRLVSSLAPGIYGHHVVRAGLLLALLGGRRLRDDDCAKQLIHKRADIHVLVVGDPGMGKSQMLTAVAALAPRGVYVCGNTTTATGLTVSVVKDPATQDFALEAGALVMGDQGVCCIDELDKMSPTELQALLEAMEHQSISVAKAGIVCSLSARTAVLAAANPASGHYDKARSVVDNLKMPASVLSRFDLLFVLLDRPNEHMDALLAGHVMGLHGGTSRRGTHQTLDRAGAGPLAPFGGSQPLGERLRASAPGLGPIAQRSLRKYLIYAREHVHPTISSEARDELVHFYLELRRGSTCADSVPTTPRQLESLVRVAEARARAELREVVTQQDAIDAIDIMRETVFFDTLGDVMGGAAMTLGSGKNSKSKGKMSAAKVSAAYLSTLEREASRRNDVHFTTLELQQVWESTRLPLPRSSFHDFIDELNMKNHLLKKGPGKWKLQCALGSRRL